MRRPTRSADALQAERRGGHADRSERSDPGVARADQAEWSAVRAAALHVFAALDAELLSGARSGSTSRADSVSSRRTTRYRFDSGVSCGRPYADRESARPAAHGGVSAMTVTSRSVRTLAPPAILAKIERDCEAAVGHAFLTLAADYLAQTRGREGRVSTVHTPA